MNLTREEILNKLHQKRDFIENEFSVKKIGIFGSYVNNNQTDESDIDFYVEFKNKTFDNLAGLWVYLEELYQKKIDIVHKHKNNNKTLLQHIKKEVVYG
jgi:predicted nucleotidyltransferase